MKTPDRRQSVSRRCDELLSQSRLDEAEGLAERLFTQEGVSSEDSDEGLVSTLAWLAWRYESREDWARSQNVRGQLLGIATRLYGEAHWRTTDQRCALEDTNRLGEFAPERRAMVYEARKLSGEARNLVEKGRYLNPANQVRTDAGERSPGGEAMAGELVYNFGVHDELRRVLFEPWPWEEPAGFAVMRAQVTCSRDPLVLLERVRGALAVILAAEGIVQASERALSMQSLSGWFSATVPPGTENDGDNRYLDWFNYGRDWRWWGARVVEPLYISVYLDILGFPVSGFDCLRWLFKRCGASEVDQGPSVDPAELTS